MSADNGVYVLNSPIYSNSDDEREYRVAYAGAIDNIDCDLVYEYLYFKDSKVFADQKSAWQEAYKIAKDFHYLEYGISELIRENPFPIFTEEEANNRTLQLFELNNQLYQTSCEAEQFPVSRVLGVCGSPKCPNCRLSFDNTEKDNNIWLCASCKNYFKYEVQ